MLTRTKPLEELGTRCMTPPLPRKEAFRIKGAYEMLSKTKTLTTIAKQKMPKVKALK